MAGTYWIGTTWYLGTVARNLVAAEGDPDRYGTTWSMHSGTIWVYEKRRTLPVGNQTIHWFKWASILSWLSGVALFVREYWFGGLMLEYGSSLSNNAAIVISVCTVVILPGFYHLIWNSGWVSGRSGVLALVAVGCVFCQIFSGRAAFMQMGVVIGTIMSPLNVWGVIFPAQRRMLQALRRGGEVDENLAARAGRRTKHNTYLVGPLMFIMTSNHYPFIYGSEYNWLFLAGVVLLGWTVVHAILNKYPSRFLKTFGES